MGRVQEAFPFQVGLKKLSDRMRDARFAVDIIKQGKREYDKGLELAINTVDSVDDINYVHRMAVGLMLVGRRDLVVKSREMKNRSVLLEDSAFVIPVLAAVDRVRESVIRVLDGGGQKVDIP